MTETDLMELAYRCEKLEGPCRETDQDIHELIVIESALSGTIYPHCKKYTASIDAAMSLCPEGWWLALHYFVHPDFKSDQDREWHAEFAGPVTWVTFDGPPEPQYECEGGNAASSPLAITAAALRARAALSRLSPPNEVKHGL